MTYNLRANTTCPPHHVLLLIGTSRLPGIPLFDGNLYVIGPPLTILGGFTMPGGLPKITIPFSLPDDPLLCGARLTFQVIADDTCNPPGTAFGFNISNGLEWILGV